MEKKKAFLMTLFGTALAGFGIGSFLTPNKIVCGGASGVATVLYHTLGLAPGVSFFIINAVLLLLGLRVLGRSFILKTLVGSTLLSLFVQVFTCFPYVTEDYMLAVIFGSVLYGTGLGLGFAAGASTGGTDILGRLAQKKFVNLPIGKILLFIDGIIIFASFFAFGNITLTLYGALSLVIGSFAIDTVIDKLNLSRLAFVITEKGEEISELLVTSSPRGVTLINAKGAYTGKDKKFLFCALKEKEAALFQERILGIDPDAFIVFAESQRIKGKGFYLYK